MRLITDKFASGHYEYFSEIPERAHLGPQNEENKEKK